MLVSLEVDGHTLSAEPGDRNSCLQMYVRSTHNKTADGVELDAELLMIVRTVYGQPSSRRTTKRRPRPDHMTSVTVFIRMLWFTLSNAADKSRATLASSSFQQLGYLTVLWAQPSVWNETFCIYADRVDQEEGD